MLKHVLSVAGLFVAVLALAGCTDTARRHPEMEDCWVIQDGDTDEFKAIACEVEIETEVKR